MAYRYYDAEKVVLGKPMKEWLQVCYGMVAHSLC